MAQTPAQNAEAIKAEYAKIMERKTGKKAAVEEDSFDWVQLHKDISTSQESGLPLQETVADKFNRKIAENPIVPIGNFFLQTNNFSINK